MTRSQPIQSQRTLQIIRNISLPNLPLRKKSITTIPGHPGCKPLVEPETFPPVHGDEVAEPLMREFVLDYFGDPLFCCSAGGGGVEEEVDDAVGYQAPVLELTTETEGAESRELPPLRLRRSRE